MAVLLTQPDTGHGQRKRSWDTKFSEAGHLRLTSRPESHTGILLLAALRMEQALFWGHKQGFNVLGLCPGMKSTHRARFPPQTIGNRQ